jgi:hypothetical protein
MPATPAPQWTAEKVRSAADALYQALLPELATPGEHLLARDLAATQAQLLQFTEALEVQHRLLQESAQLAQDVAAAHRLQVRALSKRLEALEQR